MDMANVLTRHVVHTMSGCQIIAMTIRTKWPAVITLQLQVDLELGPTTITTTTKEQNIIIFYFYK